MFSYETYGVACSEVEIDCLTGDHKVGEKTNTLMDVRLWIQVIRKKSNVF
jgi:xanthine dehydrogenase/oxidase